MPVLKVLQRMSRQNGRKVIRLLLRTISPSIVLCLEVLATKPVAAGFEILSQSQAENALADALHVFESQFDG